MKRPEYEKTFEVGNDAEGRRVFLTVELRWRDPEFTTRRKVIERETVNHQKVTEWLELSISGVVQGWGGGQIRDTLDGLTSFVVPKEQVQEIAEIWDRWHLNGMKAGCIHQSERIPNPCPEGYSYGTSWLVDSLPAEIVEKVKTWGAGQSERDPYSEQAQDFLRRFDLEVRIVFKGDKISSWKNTSNLHDNLHGDHYRVTIRRLHTPASRARSISFDFWGAIVMKQENRRPSNYDILSCVSADAHMPTDPDEVVSEVGEMLPSQAIAVAEFAARLQAFFTKEEFEALGEIR